MDNLVNLNPGIRKTVAWLNEHGFKTIDSGDGKTHNFECDREYPYAVIHVPDARDLISETLRLEDLVRGRGIALSPVWQGDVFIEASFDPCDGSAIIGLTGVDDTMLGQNLTVLR